MPFAPSSALNRLQFSRARAILNGAAEVRILVVGDLMLDRYIIGSVDRISPEAPVPVVRVEGESLALGGAGNVAANVVALGARCDVVGSAPLVPRCARLAGFKSPCSHTLSQDRETRRSLGGLCSREVLGRGFEPLSSARKAKMIGRTTPTERHSIVTAGPI